MDLSINFHFFNHFLNLYSNQYPKINIFFILNNLIRNLQKICKIPKPKTLILKKLKSQTQTWVHMSGWVYAVRHIEKRFITYYNKKKFENTEKIKKMSLPLIQFNGKCEVPFYFVCICQKCYIISV